LASTTYYFTCLDDLIASAVTHLGMLEVALLRARVASLSRRRRGSEATADVLVGLLAGEEPRPCLTEQLISRYERYIACARLPALRDPLGAVPKAGSTAKWASRCSQCRRPRTE
jgi:DNA-binding transcriptional regulator YbjK